MTNSGSRSALERAIEDGRQSLEAKRWLAGGPPPRSGTRHGTDEHGRYVQASDAAGSTKRRTAASVESWLRRHAKHVTRQQAAGTDGFVETTQLLIGGTRGQPAYVVTARTRNGGTPSLRVQRVTRTRGKDAVSRVECDREMRAGLRALLQAATAPGR